ncbi:hypothetical protein HJG54_31630 [Leptolyngbya sp. NK1-12]|uniref:Polysaccharide biosynthesis enzyme WcbI domain-containing protein n=1 Tax=Leptolyngbya sp. NK1-12 TaxID=2547451 RepID=A0AA97AK61_9CYAN|nr:hypothetical protein HJG54_31630 [Leptolyngbya sp. NK1-12]
MRNILIFANCHGAIYKNALVKAGVDHQFNIEHILSYENIENYNELKGKFSQCDALIIQPIQSYEEFKLENLKSILKSDCCIIRVPFVRFNGFWPPNDVRELERINSAAVMFFPKIYEERQVDPYLCGADLDEDIIRSTFNDAMYRFSELEKLGDVKFIDFFKERYRDIPFFRDPYHPTTPFYEYLALQITEMIKEYFSLSKAACQSTSNLVWNKEFGHFKPITDRFAQVLGLRYDLNSYFVYSRHDFLTGVLRYENQGMNTIDNLSELKNYFDTVYRVK